MVWFRVFVALIGAVSVGLAVTVVRRAGVDQAVNRRRAYFTGASYLAIGACIAALAIWPTVGLG